MGDKRVVTHFYAVYWQASLFLKHCFVTHYSHGYNNVPQVFIYSAGIVTLTVKTLH